MARKIRDKILEHRRRQASEFGCGPRHLAHFLRLETAQDLLGHRTLDGEQQGGHFLRATQNPGPFRRLENLAHQAAPPTPS